MKGWADVLKHYLGVAILPARTSTAQHITLGLHAVQMLRPLPHTNYTVLQLLDHTRCTYHTDWALNLMANL